MAKPISKQKRQKERQDEKRDRDIIYTVNIVKFTSILALRNQGWGKKRLNRFSKKFDDIFVDLNDKRLSFSDIMLTIQQETGIEPRDFVIDTNKNLTEVN